MFLSRVAIGEIPYSGKLISIIFVGYDSGREHIRVRIQRYEIILCQTQSLEKDGYHGQSMHDSIKT